jgi:hypothetical protein
MIFIKEKREGGFDNPFGVFVYEAGSFCGLAGKIFEGVSKRIIINKD